MTINLQGIFERPDLYLFAFENEDAILVEMDRAAYHRSIFLDRRIAPKGNTGHRVRVSALFEQLVAAKPAAPELCYIFHVAHCGSTLLARALDVADANLVYREPMTLRHLGVLAAGATSGATASEGWTKRLRLATAMLARRYNMAGPAIVKANVPVNFMLSEAMALNPRQPAILLYATLENYLLAVMRSPDHQAWVGRVTGEVGGGLARELGDFDPSQRVARLAAQLWLAQMLIFARALETFPTTVSLDAEALFNEPRRVITAAAQHFGQPRSDEDVDAAVGSELFSKYSKNPQQEFSNERRLGIRDEARRGLQAELDDARRWIEGRAAFERLPSQLQRPLASSGPSLVP
ncbi:MAG: hypothetical protein AB7H66_06535 [Hyphomonadaceae bacterium]